MKGLAALVTFSAVSFQSAEAECMTGPRGSQDLSASVNRSFGQRPAGSANRRRLVRDEALQLTRARVVPSKSGTRVTLLSGFSLRHR